MTDTLRKLAEAATPGPWDVDTQFNDGRDGAGGELYCSFTSYVVGCGPSHAWKSIADTTNSDVQNIETDGDAHGTKSLDEQGRRNAYFIAAANPTAVIALLDEIDQLKKDVGTYGRHYDSAEEELTALRAKVKAREATDE